MPDKPSLYVVEKKEVVILVVLFVLVTVLSFTMGVRYGESVGKKAAHERAEAEKLHGSDAGKESGGTLGEDHGEKAEAKKEAPAGGDAHGAPGDHHEAPPAHSPEAAASHTAPTAKPAAAAGREVLEKNSDEFLLNALKETGVEPPGGKAPGDAKLPQEVKQVRSGTYVIQVGSHPTRSEAESQIRALKAKKVQAEVLPPFKDRQGEWHRVVVGSYKTKRDAERQATLLKTKGAILSYFVWRLP